MNEFKPMTNAERQRKWRINNPKRSQELMARYRRKRYANDDEYKARVNATSRKWFIEKMRTDDVYRIHKEEEWRAYSKKYYEENKDMEQIKRKGRHYINLYRAIEPVEDDVLDLLLSDCECEITRRYVMDELVN